MTDPDYAALDTELRSLLALQVAPIAMTFSDQAPPNTEPHDSPIPSPTPDGRTGISHHEMTGAIPGPRLAEVVEKLKTTSAADTLVAAYVSEDKQRFDV